jgi:hypothetical protein
MREISAVNRTAVRYESQMGDAIVTYNIRLFSVATLAFALSLAGCGDDKDGTGSGTEGASTGADDDGGPGMSNTGTPDDDGSGGGTVGMTGMAETDDGQVTTTIGGPTDDGMMPVPDGGMCTEDAECESMQCFDGGLLGGICGECNEDADCPEGGCSVPNPLAGTPSTCNMGEMGGGCETTDVCMPDLVCALILDVPGVITASTCSQCETDADCGKQLCAPTYNVSEISGFKSCVDPMSVADGLGCDLEGSGDMQCASGICAGADVMGFLELGVCSECENDENDMPVGCDPGQVCMEASVDLAMGLIAGVCADP